MVYDHVLFSVWHARFFTQICNPPDLNLNINRVFGLELIFGGIYCAKRKLFFALSGIPLWVFSGVVDVVGDLYQNPEANLKLSVLRILCVITKSLFNPIHVQIKLLNIISGGIVIHYLFYFVYVGFMVI